MVFRPYPWMTFGVFAALVILIWLGAWQWDKYESGMAAKDAPPAPHQAITVSVESAAKGPSFAQQAYGLIDGEPVWRRYVPGRVDGIGDPVLLLWDATGGPEPVPLMIAGLGTRTVDARMFVRKGRRGLFTAADRPEDGVWHVFDADRMLAAFGFETKNARVVEPLALDIRLASDLSRVRRAANPYADEQLIDELPPQRHFGYALTWWGLGASLVGVYAAFHAARGRLRFRRAA